MGSGKDLGVIFPRKSGSRIINSGEHTSSKVNCGEQLSRTLEAKRCQDILIQPIFLTQAGIRHSRMLAKQTPSNYLIIIVLDYNIIISLYHHIIILLDYYIIILLY